mgnify:CR=1 FL=1
MWDGGIYCVGWGYPLCGMGVSFVWDEGILCVVWRYTLCGMGVSFVWDGGILCGLTHNSSSNLLILGSENGFVKI